MSLVLVVSCCHSFCLFVQQTFKSSQALPGEYVPNFHGRISVARHENVVLELHAGRERLVADERVQALACLYLPHADGCVKAPAHHVRAVKLRKFTIYSS